MTEFEAQVLTELARIRELLERHDAGKNNLLRVIHASVRGAEFTAAELVRHAALPANVDLQAALECEFDEPNSRRIGKFLASIAGQQVGGFIVEAIGKEREGVIWRVQVCTGKHTLLVAHRESAVHADGTVDEGAKKCG